MILRSKMFAVLGVAASAGACASAGTTAAAAPQTSNFPTVACAAGVPTTPSAAAVAAQRSLILGRGAEAVTAAQAAVAAEEGNPQHHFLLGQAQSAAGNVAEADRAFSRAQSLCPAFAAEVGPERERAWLTSFQAGLEAFQKGDTAGAVTRWEAANTIHQARPDAYYNLGVVYNIRGDDARGMQAYRQALDVLNRMPADTSAAEMEARTETRQNSLAGILSIGARQFAANQFGPSAETFRYITTVDPNHRDAWYNYTLAYYKMERWSDLVPVAQRAIALDPLNENARIILFNAYKKQAEAAQAAKNTARQRELSNQALKVLEEVTALPVYVDEIRFQDETLTGKVTGNTAAAGTPVNLTFTFHGPAGTVGTQSVSVNAPAKGQSTPFTVALPAGGITSFSYTYR